MMADEDDNPTPFDTPGINVVPLRERRPSDFLQCYWRILQLEETAAAKNVLAAVAFHARGTQGACTASVSTLARETGLSTSTVKRALRHLAERGLLYHGGRRRNAVTYRVTLRVQR